MLIAHANDVCEKCWPVAKINICHREYDQQQQQIYIIFIFVAVAL